MMESMKQKKKSVCCCLSFEKIYEIEKRLIFFPTLRNQPTTFAFSMSFE